MRSGGEMLYVNGGLACVPGLATVAILNVAESQQCNCVVLFMKRFATLLAILGSLTPAVAQAQISSSASAKAIVTREIPYAEPSDPRQRVDIYAPEGARNLPVVFWIHGGGWQTGDKTNVQVKPQAFADKGFVFVSTGYRLLTNVEMATIFCDIAKSVRWVHDHIGDYGGDPKRLLVMGPPPALNLPR
jgi:arylformamidase